MGYKDYAVNFDRGDSIVPAAITATTTGSEITLAGITDVWCVVQVGVIAAADASNLMTFTVTQCATTGGTFVAADAAQYGVADSWDRILNAVAEGSQSYAFNFYPKPGYGFIKLVATETGTFDGIFGGTFLKYGRHQPESA